MFKRFAFLSLSACSLLFGDYYSIADASLRGDKTLFFEDNVKIDVHNTAVTLQADDINLDNIDDKQPATKFHDTKLQITKEVENEFGKKVKQIQIKRYPTVNFAYMLSHTLVGDFVLKAPVGKLFIKVTTDDDTLYVFGKRKKVTVYSYEVIKAYNKQNKPLKFNQKHILKKYMAGSNLYAIEILNNGVEKLQKVTNSNLEKFLQEKQTLKTTIDSFDFKNEKLYLHYVSKQRGGSKRLVAIYEMAKKNIRTILKSPLSLFDPESHSDQIEQNVGIMRDLGPKGLYEIKKVQIINGRKDVSWLNHPKKRVVIVDFITDGKKDRNLLSKRANEQFYGIEGVFYLPYWMKTNGVDSLVFTFINGALPFDVTMKKNGNVYLMQKKGQTIYSFELDPRGFVKTMKYPSYDVTISLESADSDVTIKNKKYLQKLQKKYKIILVKD